VAIDIYSRRDEMPKMNPRIQYTLEGSVPLVQLVVPYGTTLSELVKIHETIDNELLPQIGPRGCAPCLSGVHFQILEELQNVIPVDLANGKLLGDIIGR